MKRLVCLVAVWTLLGDAGGAQVSSAVDSLLQEDGVPLGPLVSAETPHLKLTAGLSDHEVVPGKQLSLVFDVEPRRGMHVYAPGKHDYQVVSVSLDPQPWFKAARLKYPPSQIYHFKPLDQRIEVYLKPFRLVQEVTILATAEAQKLLANQKTITLSGRLRYQACDDTVCYQPRSVPVKWTVPLKRAE